MRGTTRIKKKTYAWEELDAGTFDGDDEGRGRGRSVSQSKAGIVRRHEQADDPDTSDVEKQDANVHASDGLGQVASRIFRLTGGDLEKGNFVAQTSRQRVTTSSTRLQHSRHSRRRSLCQCRRRPLG